LADTISLSKKVGVAIDQQTHEQMMEEDNDDMLMEQTLKVMEQ